MIDFAIDIPRGAEYILNTLNSRGFEAFAVGGCVRDSMLGKQPSDWDICSSATPEQIKDCFFGDRVVETGIKHGTVCVICEDGQYEITTFRSESGYSDNRRPDKVTFIKTPETDLSRRDFTVNAMAYSPGTGLLDPYGGREDLKKRLIRCVGVPEERFREDSLRILRAVRFASVLGFSVEKGTADAIHSYRGLLRNISGERVASELGKTLTGKAVFESLTEFADVFCTVIPELAPCIGFDQKNIYHRYTVYDHLAHAVAEYGGTDKRIAFALLLHDIAKPQCCTESDGVRHFRGHAALGSEVAREVLSRLRFSNSDKQRIIDLIKLHDEIVDPSHISVRKKMAEYGADLYLDLLRLKRCDALAQSEYRLRERLDILDRAKEQAQAILNAGECISVNDLELDGNDVMALGVPQGQRVAELIDLAFSAVLEERVRNEKEDLVNYVRGLL